MCHSGNMGLWHVVLSLDSIFDMFINGDISMDNSFYQSVSIY